MGGIVLKWEKKKIYINLFKKNKNNFKKESKETIFNKLSIKKCILND
jgi:hypothetical protein